MPPSPPPPKPKGKGGALAKRVGPFALWVWLVIGAALVVVLYLYMRNRTSSEGSSGFGAEIVTGNAASGPIENAYGGGSVGNESLVGQVDPTTLESLIQQGIQPYLASAGDLRGHVYELEDAFANAGYTLNEDKTWTPPMTSPEAVLDATLGPPGGGPQQNQPTPVAGVRWGGEVFTTKRGLATHLRGHGVSFGSWAAKHPQAAKKLSGPAPPPPKKKQPKQPTKKAPPPPKKAAPKKAAAPPKKKKAPPRKPAAPARRGGR